MNTTVSFTPCWKSIRRLTPRPEHAPRATAAAWLFALVLAFALALVLSAPARAESTEITSLRVDRGADGLLLSAQVRFDVSPSVEAALSKGIPMIFVAEAQLLRERWYWYDKQVASATRHMRLSYQPLTRRWRLLVSAQPIGQTGLALGQNFDTRDEALAVVQRISGWRIADADEIDSDQRYSVTLRFRLDVSQLPRPFQIGVVGHADWSIAATRSVPVGDEPPAR